MPISLVALVALIVALLSLHAPVGLAQYAPMQPNDTPVLTTTSFQATYPLTAQLRCTREPLLLQTLSLMGKTPSAQASLAIIIKRPVRLIFKPMGATFGAAYATYDALSWLGNPDDNGQQQRVIFINEVHRNAPPQALAALLAHEALHDDAENSLAEETAGWTVEATVWQDLTLNNPTVSHFTQSALVQRMNTLQLGLVAHSLGRMVANNAGYKGLADHSPGF
jgi:hypothetical protein